MRYLLLLGLMQLVIHQAEAQTTLSKEISYEYLDKLIAVCKSNYPRMKMYEARVNVAEYGVKRAKLSYFDIFSFSYLYSPNNNTATVAPSFLGGYQFGFFANIGSFLQKPSQVKQAKWEYDAAQQDKAAFDLTMEAEVKRRYFAYVQKLVVLRLRSGALLDVETMLSNVRHKFERGEETLDNYNKALLMHSDHSQNIVNAEVDVLVAKSSLEEVVGQKLEDIK